MDGQNLNNTLEAVDPSRVMLSSTGGSTIRVETSMGTQYVFPDMDGAAVKAVMPESGRIPANQPSLMLVNVSFSVLSVPFRIIKTVHIGEELVWESRA